MSIVKKWAGCVISFIAGVLGLALSACTGMIVTGSVDLTGLNMGKLSIEEITKAHKVLTDSSLYDNAKAAGIGSEFVWMKVFAIITLVLSILLIIYSVIMLLKNLNVIKSDSKLFDIIGFVLVALLLVSTIGLVVTSNIYADLAIELVKLQVVAKGIPAAMVAQLPIEVVGKIGFYQPAMLVTSIIAVIISGTCLILNRKSV